MKILLLLLLSTLTPLSLSTSLEPLTQCNADNCLRALRRRNISASLFCGTYLAASTITTTATTTRTIYSPVTLPTTTTPLPVPSSANTPLTLLPTLTYATPCTDEPTRLASACPCLLSTSLPTAAIATITVPTATTTIPVCDPALKNNNNGINYIRGTFADLINVSTQRPNNTTDAHQCCTSCYRTPGCLTYSFGFSSGANGTQGAVWPGGMGCALSVAVEGSISGPGVGEVCPFGVYLAFNQRGNEVGLGPCVEHRGI
ncbi:MAG: hypothetical protein Q9184_001818 [Pyrenodesmia sp. 2 TL-2023]